MMKLLQWFYPSLVGILLGLLQTGLFFQLSFTLSSSFRTFLMITVCWLIGSVIGLWIGKQFTTSLNVFIVVGVTAYFTCAVLLGLSPFNTGWWMVYAVFIVITGLYPGVFFVRLGNDYTARQLFFRENNGFIIGIVGSTLLFLVLGRVVLWILPFLMACIVMVCTHVYFHHRPYISEIEQASASKG